MVFEIHKKYNSVKKIIRDFIINKFIFLDENKKVNYQYLKYYKKIWLSFNFFLMNILLCVVYKNIMIFSYKQDNNLKKETIYFSFRLSEN